ncbi:MAG TPA: V-type ATPase 116kDa subunit family protein, partial [Synergistales bacterium]|nr:V-type ATPase 116kDa subunit family protein [Synergistales bacterium]
MIRDMVRIAVWGLTSQRSDVVEVLHDIGVVHLETPHRTDLSSEEIDTLRLLRGKLLGLLEALDWKEWNTLSSDLIEKARKSFDLPVAVAVKEVDKSLDQFNERLSVTLKEKSNLRDIYLQLHQAEEIINHFKGFITDEEKRGKAVSLWWTNKNTQTKLLNELRKEIRKLTPVKDREYLRYHSVPIREKENLLSLSVDLDGLPAVLSVMEAYDSIKWKAPSTVSDMSLLESMKQVEENLSWIPFRLEELDKAVNQTRNSWGPKLASLYILADEKLEELLVEEASLEKGNYFMLEGWIPADEMDLLSRKLQSVFKNDVLLRWRFPSSDEWNSVPTCLYNWKVFKPFELFLKLLETPKYRSMDPTAFIAIFFPFFSGCMVGDIGYGLVSSVFGYLLFRKKDSPILSDIGYILLFVSFWSILWG